MLIATIAIVLLGMILVRTEEKVNRMPETFRTAYLEGCTGNGGGKAYCECTLVELEKKFTNQKFLEVSLQFEKDGKTPDELAKAALKCAYLED